jgi:hypothetical protein
VAELVGLLNDLGFQKVEIREYFDCFRETSKANVAKKFQVQGVNLFAQKPG